jgi:hypothetical protein
MDKNVHFVSYAFKDSYTFSEAVNQLPLCTYYSNS